MSYVFISHSGEDVAFVEKYVHKPLETYGFSTWYSGVDLQAGEKWRDAVQEALDTCRWFLIVLTPRSVISPEVRKEFEWIQTQRPDVRILPIVMEACHLESLHPQLRDRHYIDYVKLGLRRGASTLIKNCVLDLMRQVEDRKSEIEEMGKTVLQLTQTNMELERHKTQAQKQLDQVIKFDGRSWERAVNGAATSVMGKQSRRARVIAIANIKGGVGKTTITQNLGAALWSQGKRVLLIDLDHQGSLSRRCLPMAQFSDMVRQRNLITDVFTDAGNPADLQKRAVRIGDSEGFLIGADESLYLAEERAKVRWLANLEPKDLRFRLSHALSESGILDEFDYVLLDCPPRLTTAYINGVVASDYLLLPVVVDKMSLEGLPRQLGWLRKLTDQGIIPNTQLLGVLANRSGNREKLAPRETEMWKVVPPFYNKAWGDEVYCFRRHIFQAVAFFHAANQGKFPALIRDLQPIFNQLANEVVGRIQTLEATSASVES